MVRAPVAGDKVLGGGRPVRQGQVQEFRVGALKDTGVGVELGYGFIRGPVVEAGEGGGVLLRLELGPHNRHKCFFGYPACLHKQAVLQQWCCVFAVFIMLPVGPKCSRR